MSNATPAKVLAIATQHLDVAWLWKRRPHGEELMRMVFELALDLAERHPEARFVMSRSTAWGYHVVERNHPTLFARVQEAVAQGIIEPAGGQWVEPDNVIPSGESQIRQGLYGQRYFLSRFGRTAPVSWNPDVFAHGAGLPRIYREIGIRGYYFHRVLPRDASGSPIKAFVWATEEGAEVLCFAGNWVGRPDESVFSEIERSGDASGLAIVPLVAGLASDRRMTITPDWLPLPGAMGERYGIAECRWAGSDDVLSELSLNRAALPTVTGDLGGYSYTGTYTSDQITKRYNRLLENRLAAAEFLGVWAAREGGDDHREILREAWRSVCLNQFHDIICGTCYREVQQEAHALYRRTQTDVDRVIGYVARRVAESARTEEQRGTPIVVFNPAPVANREAVAIGVDIDGPIEAVDPQGQPLPVQDASGISPAATAAPTADGCCDPARRRVWVLPGELPPLGYRVLYVRPTEGSTVVRDDRLTLENDLLRVEIDGSYGSITSFFDKRRKIEHVAVGGRFNRIVTYVDRNDYTPDANQRWDPWFIKLTGERYDPHGAYSVSVVESGPVRKTVRVVRSFSILPGGPDTEIVQELSLATGSPLLRVRVYGNWQATEACVKAEFDLARRVETVSCDMPYDVIDRPAAMEAIPMHADTNEEEPDRPMQMWIDASDGEVGLAILNNGKYGYDSTPDQIRISLMRAPLIRPGEVAGLGPFEFEYALYSHGGRWNDGAVPETALAFNRDPVVVTTFRHGGDLPGEASLFTVDDPTVHLCVVKPAEDSDEIILRLFESRGSAKSVRVHSLYPLRRARQTDALESAREVAGSEHGAPHRGDDSPVRLETEHDLVVDIGPRQIMTLAVS